MCLLPVPVRPKNARSKTSSSKSSTKSSNNSDKKPKDNEQVPRYVLDTHANTVHPISPLPVHLRARTKVPIIVVRSPPSPASVFDLEDAPFWQLPTPTAMAAAGSARPAPAKKDEPDRNTVLHDIDFVKRVAEGIGSLTKSPSEDASKTETDRAKAKEKEKEEIRAEIPKVVGESVKGIQADVTLLKDLHLQRARDEELARAKTVGFAEGEAAATAKTKTLQEEWKVKEKERREQERERERGKERRISWSRRSTSPTPPLSAHLGGSMGTSRPGLVAAAATGNWGTPGGPFWHFHAHADVGPSDGMREWERTRDREGERERQRERERERERARERERERELERERISMASLSLGLELGLERRRSSLGEMLPRITRQVLDRVVRRDVEAELVRERERERQREREREREKDRDREWRRWASHPGSSSSRRWYD
ncbi:hypothetical protein PVAG01_10345 [Phlyctema vagabunda]|uniref:Uncharacterized protein n=1 Tax=Phlyctema vagabunda TaxID=108571 RepID=A0ABR4P5P1_9HELO